MKRWFAVLGFAALAAGAHAADPLAPLDNVNIVNVSTTSHDPNSFGSVALPAGVTIYDARFRRVSRTDARAPAVVAAAEALRGLAPLDQLIQVKRIVARRVQYMSDPDSMHVADLWANAGETLASGHGDDEDIAIVEMQVLKAAGFPADDLFLTLGRHRKLGAHIVLTARTPEGFYMLDDRLPEPVRVEVARSDFKPVLSVGQGGSWVHGYRTAHR